MPPTPKQDAIDLVLLSGWSYIHGYLFAWLFEPLGWDANKTGAAFAFVWWLLTVVGNEIRRRGRFPPLLGLMLWAIPLNCSIFGVLWWLMIAVERWLGGKLAIPEHQHDHY